MTFEFDNHKSERNRQKHGIDFPAAQALWDDADRIEIPARTDDEELLVACSQITQATRNTSAPPRLRARSLPALILTADLADLVAKDIQHKTIVAYRVYAILF